VTVELWTSAAFHEEATVWVAEQLGPLGVRLSGESAHPHTRPWSTAVRYGSTAGPVWFKANGTGTAHEPALLRLLGERVPRLVPEVLAVSLDRGWSLTRDAGPVLREALDADESWTAWEGIARAYAAAQVELSGARDDVLAAGVPEVSPASLPELVRGLLAELSGRPTDRGGLDAEQADRLRSGLPRFDDWCDRLASAAVPDSVQHDDLHSGNVCWGGSVASARVIDWGDASWGTPLATLLTTTRSLAFHAGVAEDAPQVLRVRDAYLEPFTAYADRDELLRLVGPACGTGHVGRALSWRAALQDAPASTEADMEYPVRAWLLELLDVLAVPAG